MRRVCLTLPTDRACADTLPGVVAEAEYAAGHFDVEVHLLVLDSAPPAAFRAHAAVLAEARRRRPANLVVLHLDEPAQRRFLRQVVDRAAVPEPDVVLDLMLPTGVSYGACTNRAFLIAAALGCRSVHRRDSDSRYQMLDGAYVFPIHHELTALGRPAADVTRDVTHTVLAPGHRDRPVAMVGSSFVGELSVDIADIRRRDPGIYHDVVGLWAPREWSAAQRYELVEESFTGAGTAAFTDDLSTLTLVDPMRVDMCNVSFHQVHEDVPLPPATDTIGSDYFLIHLVHDAALPGVLHNRNIVNFHTGERKTDAGFTAYQLRLTKFFLSMLYFHVVYARMAAAGDSLLDRHRRVQAAKLVEFVRASAWLDQADNVWRLDSLDRSYRRLGGRYAVFADLLAARRERLLAEAQQDMVDYAQLIEAWEPLIRASRATDIAPAPSRRT